MTHHSGAGLLGAVGLLSAALLGQPGALAAQQDSMQHNDMMQETMMAPHGMFAGAHDHITTGGYEIVTRDGKQWLTLGKDFALDGAPDPYVVLSADAMGASKGAVNLGRLRRLKGSSAFQIPAGTDLHQFTKVLIWCRKFDVTLGVADLAAPKDKMMRN